MSGFSFPFPVSPGGRSIHDGFATIRTGAGKRGRARSSPSVVNELRSTAPCHHGCCNTTLGRTWGMEPLWEEKGNVEQQGAQPVAKRDRAQLPWWEVATRRSKYRSCPAFSQVRRRGARADAGRAAGSILMGGFLTAVSMLLCL